MTWTWIALGLLGGFALATTTWFFCVLEISRRLAESLTNSIAENENLRGENGALRLEIEGWRVEAAEAHRQIVSLAESSEKLADERDELFTHYEMTRETARRN